jgi:hypothetical protein
VGKKSHKETSTSTPWQPAQPILLGAGNDILNTVDANKGNLQQLSGNLNGMLPGLQSMAMDNSMLQPATGYLNDVLGGKYLGQGNPYLNAMVHQGEQDAGNAVNSTFSMAGRTGGGNHAADLARGVAQAGNALRYQDYANERNNMTQAAGMLPGINASRFAGVTPLLGAYQLAGQLPYYGTNALGNIGSLYSGYGKETATKPGGWLDSILGAGAAVGSAAISNPAIFGSDRRLKTNIVKVGEAKDGLGIYEWNWKADPNGEPVMGVIADEVEKLRPWAFVPNFRGDFAGVNYATLGSLE